MEQTLLIERVMDETRMAVVEDGQLCELHIERPGIGNLTGNIYLGRVQNAVRGMDAAFVDIGLDKNGFLSAGDIRANGPGEHDIARLAKPGQELLVQVAKSQPGAKGPRLTTKIALPGRLMALLPGEHGVGVSKKIEDPAERERLRGVGQELAGVDGPGMILRTASGEATVDALRLEYGRLNALWERAQNRAAHGVAPLLLHDDNALLLRAVRDRLGEDTAALWVDDAACFDELRELARSLAPAWLDRIRLHDGATPLFDLYRVDAQVEKALEKYVWLKNGGSIVLEETEAMTVVDVNTAKNTGGRGAEETLFENNCEAAREIMRQLRLRDIGGIVVIDFIDMAQPARREALLDLLRECAKRDGARVNVMGITSLGLVELTRKKARQSLSRQLLHTCSACGGSGVVVSHETAARRIVRDVWRRRRAGEANAMLVEAASEVCGWLGRIGLPSGGPVYARPVPGMAAGEYRLSPAEVSALPPDCKLLK